MCVWAFPADRCDVGCVHSDILGWVVISWWPPDSLAKSFYLKYYQLRKLCSIRIWVYGIWVYGEIWVYDDLVGKVRVNSRINVCVPG